MVGGGRGTILNCRERTLFCFCSSLVPFILISAESGESREHIESVLLCMIHRSRCVIVWFKNKHFKILSMVRLRLKPNMEANSRCNETTSISPTLGTFLVTARVAPRMTVVSNAPRIFSRKVSKLGNFLHRSSVQTLETSAGTVALPCKKMSKIVKPLENANHITSHHVTRFRKVFVGRYITSEMQMHVRSI